MHRGVFVRFKQEVVNIFVHELSFVDEPITEPDVDRIKSTDHTQTGQSHLFANLTSCAIAIGFILPNMTLGKRPLPV